MTISIDTIRIFVHVLAASVWVGGQIVLAGLVPTLRRMGGDAPKQAAQAFNRIAWPAFGIAVATGVWNLNEIGIEDTSSGYQVAILVKLALVAASGVGAYLHTTATTKSALAIWGAVGAVGALAAMFYGAVLATNA
jgi:putative copper export protein